jgi:dTDP-4-amino-4,6-dideoxygalactose transaminase
MIGGMFRMAGIQGAVLNVKLKYLNEWHEARRKNAALYDQLLAGSKVVTAKQTEARTSETRLESGPPARPKAWAAKASSATPASV